MTKKEYKQVKNKILSEIENGRDVYSLVNILISFEDAKTRIIDEKKGKQVK